MQYKEILAGIYIGLVGFANLVAITQGYTILGSFLFPAGLMLICCMNYRLFTGMVRWLPSSRDYQYSITLLIVLIGNLIGVIFVSLISSFSIEIVNAAELICLKFINELWYIVLFKGILCGLCITAACQAYPFNGGYVITFLMVMIFVFCGMRHCIADAYYLSVSGMWAAGLLNWFCIVIGNIIGGVIPTLFENNC